MSRAAARLVWGVKQSFRAYVQASGGTVAVNGGAALTEAGEIAFPAAPEAATLRFGDAPSGRAAFSGSVRFAAHGGMLDVRLADPAVEIGEAGAMLSVEGAGGRRAEIATLDLTAAERGADGEWVLPAALTVEGSFVLGDHYPPGTGVDAVRVWV